MRHHHIRILSCIAIVLPMVTFVASIASAAPLAANSDARYTLNVNGTQREYLVHVPSAAVAGSKAPVVIMFHGGGGTAAAAMTETGWTRKADEAGFIAVFPEGTRPDPSRPARFKGNPQTWNDGSGRFPAGAANADDVGFTRALLGDLEKHFAVDAKRIFVTGFSNGSSLTYRIGVELADRVAAIAPIASSGLRIKATDVKHQVSLLAIQGGKDPLNPQQGGDVRLPGGQIDPRPPIRASVDAWTRMLDCAAAPSGETVQNGVQRTVWRPCRAGSEVEFIVIDDMGHTWPGGKSLLPKMLVGNETRKLVAVDVIWDFFARHAKGE